MRSEGAVSGSSAPCEARFVEIVFPHHCNHLGTLFGGQALAWMDKAAFLVASRFAGRAVVTARSDRIDFREAVKLGEIVELVANVSGVRRSSMLREAIPGAEQDVATSGEFVMVAVDARGCPVVVERALSGS